MASSKLKSWEHSMWRFKDTSGLLSAVLETLSYFHLGPKKQPAILPYHWVKGTSNVAVLLGENASGKSFVRKCASSICHGLEVEFIGISMQMRSEGGFARAFVFGDEGWEATGVISIKTVLNGIRTCRGRDTDHVMCWDEPDLGLSDSAAASVGAAIAEFVRNPGKHTKAILVATHNRQVVEQLAGLDPHYVYLGDNAPATLQDWLHRPIVPVDLEALSTQMMDRWRAISAIIDGKKKKGV
jgi:hypothetical protein